MRFLVLAPLSLSTQRLAVLKEECLGRLFMKLGITGSRTITDFDFIPYFTMQDKVFRAFCRKHGLGRRKITEIITGGAKGIDTLAFLSAESAGIRNRQFLPDRKKFPGKLVLKAFQERNKQIVDRCDILLAVWDGKSHGTKNTLAYAQLVGKPAFLIRITDRRRLKHGSANRNGGYGDNGVRALHDLTRDSGKIMLLSSCVMSPVSTQWSESSERSESSEKSR